MSASECLCLVVQEWCKLNDSDEHLNAPGPMWSC
jgi:hypothetical protein